MKVRTISLVAIIIAILNVAATAEQGGWKLVSAPCETAGRDITGLFTMAPAEYIQVNSYGEYEMVEADLVPGKGYWMYFDDDANPAQGCMVINAREAKVMLHEGWNIIGNPFTSSAFLPAGITTAYEYDSTQEKYKATTSLEPWKGYFIKAPEGCGVSCEATIANPEYSKFSSRRDAPVVARVVSCPVSGDTDGSGLVDASDIFPISQYYGTTVSTTSTSAEIKADADGNGLVDASDLFVVSRNYGNSCGSGSSNTIPSAVAQSVSVDQDQTVSITLAGSDPDGDTLTYTIVSNPAHGTLDVSAKPVVVYTPDSGYYGADSFTFSVNDGSISSLSTAVTITVKETVALAGDITGVTVAQDPSRRYSTLIVTWDVPSDESINAFDIYCNDELVNECPLRLECFSGMDCDPDMVYRYYINIPSLASAPADPSNFTCAVQVQGMAVDDSTDLIAAASKLSAAVAAGTFAHTADSPFAGGTTSREGAASDCSAQRSGGRLAGRNAAATTGSTVVLPNARIEAWRKESTSESPNGTLVATVYSNDQGYYEFSSLDPGYYNFIAYHDNGTTQTDDDIYSILDSVNIQPSPFNEGGFNNLGEMKLEETGSIYGRVKLALDSTGATFLDTPDDTYLGIDIFIPGTSFTAKANRSGEFYILYLPPATYSIVSTADNYALVQTDGVKVESKQITTVTPDIVLLASIGSVIGQVSFADSSNDGDASVSLVNESDSSDVHTTSTLTDGSFTFSGIATGTYTLGINRYGWDPYSQTGVLVESNTTTDVGSIGPVARIPGPIISSITPSAGDNDADVTITVDGSNFSTGTIFYIKKGLLEAELETPTYVTDSQMTTIIPAGYQWGSYDIKALNPDAQSVTVSEVFSVTLPAPSITSISPAEMDNSASLELTVNGKGFVNGVQVRVGTTLTSNTIVGADGATVTTTVPSGMTAGVYDVVAKNPDSAARSATLSGAFTTKALSNIDTTPDADGVVSISAGATKQLAATCSYTDGTITTSTDCTTGVQWISSNTSVATITLTGGLLTAVQSGTTYITAQKGTLSSQRVQIAVYRPEGIFLDSGQQIFGTKDHQTMSYAADLDDDGDLDLVSSNSGYARPYLNDGTGTVAANNQNMCGHDTGTAVLGVADFDGDGDLDVVCAWDDVMSSDFGSGIIGNGGDASSWVGGLGGYADGVNTTSVAVADFNMDGRPDWAVSNPGGGNFVMFVNSNGTSTDSGQSLGTANTSWLAAGDIDGDGDSDLVEGNWAAANKVWINDGTGVFTDSGQSMGSADTMFIALADFDADGDLDIFEGTGGQELDPEVPDAIWLNDGNGTFTVGAQSFPNTRTWGAAAVDVDNDGDMDLVVGTAKGASNIVYLNDGNASFTDSGQQWDSTYTNSIAAGDFNGDNKIDFADSTFSGIFIYFGGQGGIPANTQPSAPGSLSQTVEDVEGDMLYNDVTLSWDEGSDSETPDEMLTYNINIFRPSDGFVISSELTPFTQGFAGHAKSVSLRNLPDGTYKWRVQTVDSGFRKSDWSVSGQFVTGMTFTSSAGQMGTGDTGSVVAADLDGDGDVDIIEGRNSTGGSSNVTWTNDGAGTFTEYSSFGTTDTGSLALADLDGDGDLDLVDGANGQNYVWLNDGSGGFTDSGWSVGTGDTTAVITVDMDNDGDYDIFAGNSGGPSEVYRNGGSGFTTFYSIGTYSTTTGAATQDVDGDGAIDLSLGWSADGMGLFMNDGYGVLESPAAYTYPTWGSSGPVNDVVIGDITDDGYGDFVLGLDNDYILFVPGKSYGAGSYLSSSPKYISDTKMKARKVRLADMDVDGDLDIVVMNYKQPMQIFLNDGYVSFVYKFTAVSQSMMPVSAAVDGVVADVDGDGDLDVVVAIADGYGTTGDLFLLNSQVVANTQPSAPTGLSATSYSNTTVLNWSSAVDTESSATRLTYDVKIKDQAGSTWLRPEIATPGPGGILNSTRTVVIRNIPSGTYDWYVRAIDPGLLDSSWTQGSAFVFTADATPPVFAGIQSLSFNQITNTMEMSWTAATDDSLPVSYNIYEAAISGGQNYSSADFATYGTSMEMTGLTDGQQYCYVVRAQDSASPSNEDTNTTELCDTAAFDLTPPVFGGITGAVMGSTVGSIDISWTAATDANGPVTYNVYYATSSGGQNFTSPNTTTTSSTGMTVSGLVSGEIYYLVVRAEDKAYAQNEDANSVELSAQAMVIPDALIIDADAGGSMQTYYETALTNAGITYMTYSKATQGAVSSTTLQDFIDPSKIVIWLSGDSYNSTAVMTSAEASVVISFLDAGGRIFFTGEDVGFVIKGSSTTLYNDYMKVTNDTDYPPNYILEGVTSDPITDGITLTITGGDGANNQNYRSYFDLNGATAIFTYQSSALIGASRYDSGTYRVVYFAFGFEAIDNQADRDTIIQNVFNWLTQ